MNFVDPELRAAVERGFRLGESASVVAQRHGITRNAVIGLWNRGRGAGRIGHTRLNLADIIWNALVAAGPTGCTIDQLGEAVYAGDRPSAWEASIRCQVQRVGSLHKHEGFVVCRVLDAPVLTYVAEKVEPRALAEAPAASADAAAPVKAKAKPARSVTPAARSTSAGITSSTRLEFVGAAAAFLAADRAGADQKQRTCRWPNEAHPRDPGFRFCGAVVVDPVIKGRDGVARQQPYCEACREKARPARVVAPMRLPGNVALGYAARVGSGRAVAAGPLRFGRAGA